MSTPSDKPKTLKQARRDLAALRVTCYKDRSQRSSVPSGDADSDRPSAGEDVDMNIDSSDDKEECPTISCRTNQASLTGCPGGSTVT